MNSQSAGYTVHVISHTHWDREWYLPFPGFQDKLVEAVDRLLAILARNPSYIFHLDGQVVLLEDYLARKPGNRGLLTRYIEQGNIVIGPWYVMPDEFLVSPESLYRNLRLGISLGSRFGPVMKIGYLPDTFGHISQLAQLLRRYGISRAVVRRGMTGAPEKIRSEFILEAPDGSRVLSYFLVHGYTNARALGIPNRALSWLCRRLLSLLTGPAFSGDRTNGLRDHVYHYLSYPATYWILHSLAALEDCANREGLARRETASLAHFTAGRDLLFFNGGDHQPPRDIAGDIEEINRRGGDRLLKQDTLEGYFRSVATDDADLPVVRGELRSSHYSPLLSGTLSARVFLKQTNHRIETLAEKWSYPWAAIASLVTGKSYPREKLEAASRLYIQNHAHDSICGSSISQVTRDMTRRFDRAEGMLLEVMEDSLNTLTGGRADAARVLDKEPALAVFNPSPHPRSEVVTFRAENAAGLVVCDDRGEPAQCQTAGPQVEFLAESVPALGYKLFYPLPNAGPALQTRQAAYRGDALENEHLVLRVLENGTFMVTHKASGRTYGPLGYFEDGGDAGDTYNYAPPREDSVITTLESRPRISLTGTGALTAGLRIEYRLDLPESLGIRARSRRRKTAPNSIVTTLTLKKASPLVHIHTEVNNRSRDHRLRVIFPTGLKADRCCADGHWDVITRSVWPEPELDRQAIKSGWFDPAAGQESASLTQPQRRFVDVSDGSGGLAVINRGLPEYEVRQDGGATIALTLLRGVGWLSRSAVGTRRGFAGPVRKAEDAQCPGKYSFDYALMPHTGDWEQSGAYIEAENFNAPCRVRSVPAPASPAPPERGFLEVAPRCLMLSGMELSEAGELLVRVYNIGGRAVRGSITPSFTLEKADMVDFNENPVKEAAVKAGSLAVEARSREVVMLRLKPG
ncbi:MAG: hypothetical protein HYX96_07415 [Chloroflexi bacterium]|nr:hypothetical protein [Chloroflexota bacterium]